MYGLQKHVFWPFFVATGIGTLLATLVGQEGMNMTTHMTTMTTHMTPQDLADMIEDVSARLCADHLGYTPAVWYTGGPSHNDDRLSAAVEGERVVVTDGQSYEMIAPSDYADESDVEGYVEGWLGTVWECVADEQARREDERREDERHEDERHECDADA